MLDIHTYVDSYSSREVRRERGEIREGRGGMERRGGRGVRADTLVV